jgi:hypothetical protein
MPPKAAGNEGKPTKAMKTQRKKKKNRKRKKQGAREEQRHGKKREGRSMETSSINPPSDPVQTGLLGWPNPPPGPWGWSGHPQKAKTHFSFFRFFFFGLLGVVRPPPWPWGWFDHPQCNTPSPLRLGLSLFFFYNKIFAKIHKVYQST